MAEKQQEPNTSSSSSAGRPASNAAPQQLKKPAPGPDNIIIKGGPGSWIKKQAKKTG